MDCIFCKIISGEIPSEKVYESDKVVAFKDINPMAPVHILIIPKEHIGGADELNESNVDVVKDIMLVAKHLAKSFNLDNGWRLVSNVGEDGGQTVRLHFHLLGGKKLSVELAYKVNHCEAEISGCWSIISDRTDFRLNFCQICNFSHLWDNIACHLRFCCCIIDKEI